ncbi:hypothetical protein DV738_g110, partial [Chaetothyriales sp. CBS 135597]
MEDSQPGAPTPQAGLSLHLFSSINIFAQQPKQQSPGSSSSRLHNDEHLSGPSPSRLHTDDHFSGPPPPVFPRGRHSPSRSESQPRAQFSSTPPAQAQDENVASLSSSSSQEVSIHGLAHHDGTRTKTVVRQEYVHGKGVCYVYDDGTLCPKAINGLVVNPKWGTTKAGKPRKRLGQACNTCREKKIRCEPQVPKCAQCQKFGRECKFETGKSSQKGAPSSPVTPEPQKDLPGDMNPSSPSAETPSEQTVSSHPTPSVSANVNHLSPTLTARSDEEPPPKRRTLSVTTADKSPARQALPLPAQGRLSEIESDAKPVPGFSATVDPFVVDARLTSRYVRQAMGNLDTIMFHLLPTTVFANLASVDESRPIDARGVLYAMMAFCTTFSNPDQSSEDERSPSFHRIAEACLIGQGASPSCYDALTNLILSFQASSSGNPLKSKQLNQRCIEICYQLGINTEEGLEKLVSESGPWFNLQPAIAKESLRRLFWVSHVGSYIHAYTSFDADNRIHLECALRLPCDDRSYESGMIPALPVFRCSGSERQAWNAQPGHGPLVYLLELAMILNDTIENLSLTASYKPQESEAFLRRMKSRLLVVDRALRSKFSDSPQARISTRSSGMRPPSGNMASSGTCGIHLFYHLVAMVLNRYVAWRSLSAESIDRCVKDTYNHAVQTMDLLNRMDVDGGPTMQQAHMTRSSPIAAMAVLAAIDVITAAGPISDIFEHQDEGGEHGLKKMAVCALEILEEHSEHWREAGTHSDLVKSRLKLLLSLRHGQIQSQKAFFFRTPLHSPYGMDLDIVYGLPHTDYFKALGWGRLVQSKSDMMEMGVQSLDRPQRAPQVSSFPLNMSSTSLTTTTPLSSPLPSRPFGSPSGSGTTVPLRTPIAKPSPGTFRHPYLAEVVRRQSKAAVSASNVNTAALNAGALLLITAFYNTLQQSLSWALRRLTPVEPDSAASLASYTLYGLVLLFVANILLSLRPLLPFAKPATYDDIPLTPSQRHLLGLPPSNTATPQSNSRGGSNAPSPFITPPRYTRRLSSSSASLSPSTQATTTTTGGGAASSATTTTGRFSTMGNYSPSPLSSPSRHALTFGSPVPANASSGASLARSTSRGSPFSPGLSSSNVTASPLFHKALHLSQDRSSEPSFDLSTTSPVLGVWSSDTSLARSTSLRDWSPSRRRNAAASVADREQRSPVQKGINYKWMYDKGF